MIIFNEVVPLQAWLALQRNLSIPIAFVPTMGALHSGHISLVKRAKAEGQSCVVSIFVNPTQFNDPKDLEKYPRTPEADIALLEAAGTEALFMPAVQEVYPPHQSFDIDLDFGGLENVLEGAFRPGHFKGMVTVVWRLLQIVQPTRLYMGQKDFQQSAVVARMLQLLKSPIILVVGPTSRESDGLARSSRNVRLDAAARALAPRIHEALQTAKKIYNATSDVALAQEEGAALLADPAFKTEYFTLVDGHTLQTFTDPETTQYPVALVATWLGGVRLIDNLPL